MWKVRFQINRAFWWLDLVTRTIHELTAWPVWKFCPVVQQLAWPFCSPYMLHTCAILATCKSRAIMRSSRETLLECTHLSILTLSHTLPLHNSHLNTRYLIAKLQANLARNEANTWLNKFNLTVSFWVIVTRSLKSLPKYLSHRGSGPEVVQKKKKSFQKWIFWN